MFGRNRQPKYEPPTTPEDINPFSSDYTPGKSFSQPRSLGARSLSGDLYGSSYSTLPPLDQSSSSYGNSRTSNPFTSPDTSSVIPEANYNGKPSRLRKFAAAVLIAGSAAGLIPAGAYAINQARSHDISFFDSNKDAVDFQETALDPTVQLDFEEALKQDTCETKVSAAEVTDTYHQLFDHTLPDNLSLDQFSSLVDQQTNEIKKAREDGNYATLPANYQQLWDKLGTDEIPLSTYQQSLDSYLGDNFGIKVEYSVNKDDPILRGVDTISPSDLSKHYSDSLKAQALSIMEDTGNIAPDLVRESVNRMVFGNVTATTDANTGAGGFYLRKTIVFDLNTTLDSQVTSADTPTHEITHGTDDAICKAMAWKYQDTAYESLNNPRFTYGVTTYNDLKALGRTREGVTTLIAPPGSHGSVELTEAYGALNGLEDRATAGELAFSPEDMSELFSNEGDTRVLREKIALLTTRASVDSPATKNFTIAQMASAQLEVALEERIEVLRDERDKLRSGKGFDGDKDPSVQAKDNEINQYYEQLTQLKSAMSGTPHIN